MNSRVVTTATVLVFVIGVNGWGEIPNKSVEKLEKEATHIVVGTMGRTYTDVEERGDFRLFHKVAELKVQTVEKGAGIESSRMVYLRFWRQTWKGAGNPPPGHSGHRGVPQRGEGVRVYLKQHEDGGYDVVGPNGYAPLNEKTGS